MPQKKAAARTDVKTKPKAKARAKTATRPGPKAKAAPKGRQGKSLGKKELEEMRAAIMAERRRIIHELGRIEETINDATQGQEGSNQSYSNHLADIGTDYMEQEKNFYYASQEGHYLRSLDEALERIDRGEYGICEMCGELIGELRLKAVPSARLCIKCKSESEKTQRGR
ncbi:MAG: TraR/DksA C4-type zinc finger protein [Candidatus Krumholzibacteria bacterium]|nr:TraR/DksA C4-type zinc finger protein [Candidatus Krumholzibacteria bacterium]